MYVLFSLIIMFYTCVRKQIALMSLLVLSISQLTQRNKIFRCNCMGLLTTAKEQFKTIIRPHEIWTLIHVCLQLYYPSALRYKWFVCVYIIFKPHAQNQIQFDENTFNIVILSFREHNKLYDIWWQYRPNQQFLTSVSESEASYS